MSEDPEEQPYAGPGRETTRRRDMPEDHQDVKEFVEAVDEQVPEEHLEPRIPYTYENPADPPEGSEPPD